MNLLTALSAPGDRFELPGGLALLRLGHRARAGRNMTLGIRPEHIALSLQAEGGVPLTVDTLRLGSGYLAHGRWAIRNWWCGWRISSARWRGQYAMAASAGTSAASF